MPCRRLIIRSCHVDDEHSEIMMRSIFRHYFADREKAIRHSRYPMRAKRARSEIFLPPRR